MKILIFIGLLVFIFYGCSENKSSENGFLINNPPADEYASGDVAFGLQDTVSLEYFAAYIYSLSNISIDEIVFFQYSSFLSQDSIQILKSVLESKPYIDSRSHHIFYIQNGTEIIVEFCIKNFKSEHQSDWDSVIDQFNLSHYPNYFQLGILKVEVGKEKEWIDYLSDNELFRFVELNYIGRIH